MRASGQKWSEIARELDVLPTSLQRWVAKLEVGPLLPVIIDEVPSVEPTDPAAPITLTTPDGYRLEGLDVDSASLLVELLR